MSRTWPYHASRISSIALPAAVLAALSISASPAQAPSSPHAPSAVPSLTANADEVSLDLIVRTKHNRPVLNLKPSDLAITDDGSTVNLSGLQLVSGNSKSDRLVTLLFDRLDPSSARAARSIAAKILNAIPEKGYSLAVLQINGRLRLLQTFTPNRQQIDSAIAAATPTNPSPPSASFTPAEKHLFDIVQSNSLNVDSSQRANARLLLAALEDSQRIVEEQHAILSLAALQALAESQRQIAGRKVILWFAQGIRANSDARDAIASIVGQANRAGVTISPIDTNAIDQQVGGHMQAAMAMSTIGMGGALSSSTASGGAPTGFIPGAELNPVSERNTAAFQFGAMDADQSPLLKLASATGGIYLRAGGSSKHQLQQLHDDLTSYYEASYIPPITDYNGAFRPIAIRPLRKDLIVRTRAGYFAVPPDKSAGILPWEASLLKILLSPQLPTAIAFRTAVLHLGQLPDGNTGDLTVEVPVSQLQIREDANTHISSAHATILALVKNGQGAVLRRFSQDVPLHESPDLLRKDPGQVITMQHHFSADPGTYTLETAVADANGNVAGAQRTTFTIAPVPPGPALSDLVLVQKVEPVHEDTAAFDPMRYEDGRILPSLNTELPENTSALSFFFMVHPLAGSTAQPQLQMRIRRNGESLGVLPLDLHKVSGTGAAIPYYGTLQGRVFPPGNYQVEAVLTQDGQSVTSTATFSVEGTIAASTAPAASITASSDAAARQLASADAIRGSLFVIVSPAHPIAPPTDAEVHDIITAASQRALSWFDSLENFFCVEVTNHSTDATGNGDWKHKDTLVELIRYVDHHETRSTLQLNGEPSTIHPDQLQFAWSVGEFGAMFHILFDPSAHADFAWKESDVLDGAPVQVFTFNVPLASSSFVLSDKNNRQSPVGFHGLLYLDAATRAVRRITVEADDIPPAIDIRAASISIDYSWISISTHDYLLPIRGAISLREAKHAPVLNEFEFRNYRRFGSQIRVLTKEESKKLPN